MEKGPLACDFRLSIIPGYAAGYCTYEEAMDKSLEAAVKAQESFGSWDDFNQSYLYGYAYWTGEDLQDSGSSAAERASRDNAACSLNSSI